MIKKLKQISTLSFFIIALFSCESRKVEDVTLYENGYIYNGETFDKKNFYVKKGKVTFNNLILANNRIDLKDKFVIPPLGDAHTHNFDDIKNFDSIYSAYTHEGTFYIQVLTNHFSNYLEIKDSLNKPGKLDVAFAHGGLTSTGGHPHALYETSGMGMDWRAMLLPENKDKIKNSRKKEKDAYYLMDSTEDVNNQWEEILSKNPSILKIYISNFKKRQFEIEAGNVGTYGLSEEVAKAVIEKSKESNLTIYAHIESVDDFSWALENGVNHFAHMPGYGGGFGKTDLDQFIIPDSILHKASEKNVVITPTVSFTKYYSQVWNGKEMSIDSILFREKQYFLKNQLARFHKAGINIALGSDQGETTVMEEIKDINALKAFNNKDLLSIILGTSKHIFPNRKIGEIKEGYEASFLVLDKNPLEEIQNIRKINLRVKNGIVLN